MNSPTEKILLDRREIFKIIPGFIGMERILDGRKPTGTLKMQVEMIKLLWKISKQAGCDLFFHAPIGRFLDNNEIWENSTPIQIISILDDFAIIAWSEDIGRFNSDLPYVEGNKIIFEKMPEVINYAGDFCLIAEAFRLQLKKFQYTWRDFI